jgi:molybdopterin biosynthesis enzyme
MAELPKLEAALERVMGLSYPAVTLDIPVARAAGHRLARAVTAKGSQPSRPFALTDGLAVMAADVQALSIDEGPIDIEPETEPAVDLAIEPEPDVAPPDLVRVEDQPRRPLATEEPAVGDAPLAADDEQQADESAADAVEAEEPAADQAAPTADNQPEVLLELRPFPATSRREDALGLGQAIAIPVGGEVPRGAEVIYPFAWVEHAAEGASALPAGSAGSQAASGLADGEEEGEDDKLPVAEPPRDWDMPSRHLSGTVLLKRLYARPTHSMVPIGAWARNREVLVPEKTVLRPPDVALLEALGVEEVEVYRRPVVGVASLGLPFPEAGRPPEKAGEGPCPLLTLSVQLMRAARVAALPLGYAPLRFRELLRLVQRWVSQVDILVLVGGSHSGARGLALDVISSAGEVALSGLDLHPGGNLSCGRVSERPVFALPGSLPDVLSGLILMVRPLAHKYLIPPLYSSTLELELEHGSRLQVERTTVAPIRFGLDRERGVHTTRYSGRQHDPWLDYIRGQALLVLEGGRRYSDGERATVHLY